MKKVNSWINKRVADGTIKVMELTDKAQSKLANLDIEKQCKVILKATKLGGKDMWRSEVLKGFPKDFAEALQPGMTADDLLKPYRDEPLFEKVLKRLSITWEEIESMAKEAVSED